MRTFFVFVGGAFAALVVEIMLTQWLTPQAAQVIHKMFTTPPKDPQWNELWLHWSRINWIALYVISPIAGVVAGAFVGLIQKRHVAAVAALCLDPDLMKLIWSDHARLYASPTATLLRFTLIRSMPFLAAIMTAVICRHWMLSRENRVGSTTEFRVSS